MLSSKQLTRNIDGKIVVCLQYKCYKSWGSTCCSQSVSKTCCKQAKTMKTQTFSFLLGQHFVDCREKLLGTNSIEHVEEKNTTEDKYKDAEAEILPPKRKREQNRLQNNRIRHSFVLWMTAFESSRTRSVLTNISFKSAVNTS